MDEIIKELTGFEEIENVDLIDLTFSPIKIIVNKITTHYQQQIDNCRPNFSIN